MSDLLPIQPPLFPDAVLPAAAPIILPHNGTFTSRAAAASVRPRAATQAGRILNFLHGQGRQGATREEISQALAIRLASVCPRVHQLMKDGAITEEGARRTSSGEMAKILVVCGSLGVET